MLTLNIHKQIRPKLDYQFSLARKMELVDAVQEIAMIDNNNNNEWMSEEYKEILRDQESIRYAFAFMPIFLFRIQAALMKLL